MKITATYTPPKETIKDILSGKYAYQCSEEARLRPERFLIYDWPI